MIDEKKLIEDIKKSDADPRKESCKYVDGFIVGWNTVVGIIKSQPKVGEWIPFTQEWDEEALKYMLNCKLPEEDEEILVTDGKDVWQDTFLCNGDNEYYLDSNNEFVTEAIAWMPLPEPYKVKESEEE